MASTRRPATKVLGEATSRSDAERSSRARARAAPKRRPTSDRVTTTTPETDVPASSRTLDFRKIQTSIPPTDYGRVRTCLVSSLYNQMSGRISLQRGGCPRNRAGAVDCIRAVIAELPPEMLETNGILCFLLSLLSSNARSCPVDVLRRWRAER